MKILTAPTRILGRNFTTFELDLSQYPEEGLKCCEIVSTGIELLYIGGRKFKLLAIDGDHNVNTGIPAKRIRRGAIVAEHDCGKYVKSKAT